MATADWSAVDDYFVETLLPADPALDGVFAANAAAGLPAIDVSPPQGKLLNLIARMIGAKRILEVGTLGGYSTIWLARALPASGRVISLEVEPRHAEQARRNLAAAGVAEQVEVRVGPASETLAQMVEAGEAPFDLVFIDADKPSNPTYLGWALKLTKAGSVIVCDNVVRGGAVADAASADPNVRGIRQCLSMMAAEPRLSATAIQTVGSKGWDGFAIALVR